MLELIDVKKIYSTTAGDVAAMDGVSIKFPDSGMVFINGKSGSGKTTLLNVIGGLDDFDSGEIIIDGKNFSSFTPSDYDSYRNTFVGFIFQEYNLLPDYTVEKNIMLANELQGKATSKDVISNLMEEFDIAGLQKRKISQLSGGQKQRVAIVRSLVKDPKIIMADEPTGALDSVTGVQVIETLKKLSKDKLVIVVSHDLELAEKYADRIIRIVDGQVVEDVTITDSDILGNVHTDESSITVKSGANLDAHETEELLKAIREKKKVNFTEIVTIRKKSKTKDVPTSNEVNTVKFIKSKMKYSSAAELGVKSLAIKPGRLIFTILLSVVAFAVFGLFDTIASYKDARAIQNLLRHSGYNAVSVYQEYDETSNYYTASDGGFRNIVKFTKEDIENLSKESGYKFRPVYDLQDNDLRYAVLDRDIRNAKPVTTSYAKSVGILYYIPKVSGFVEFKDSEIEYQTIDDVEYAKVIDKNGFNLRLKYGNLPKFFYDEKSDVANDKEVAISEYLATSIAYWQSVESETEVLVSDLIDTEIKVESVNYVIKGIYDCGAIPEKYEELKYLPISSNNSLADDLKTYLNSGLYFNLIVGEGYTDYIINNQKVNKIEKCRIPTYYSYSKVYTPTFTDVDKQNAIERFYNFKDIDSSKIIMFDEERNKNISLADDEVLVNIEFLEKLYEYEEDLASKVSPNVLYPKFEQAKSGLIRQSAITVSDTMKGKMIDFINVIKELCKSHPNNVADHIKNASIAYEDNKGNTINKIFKVVGVYTGLDTDLNKISATKGLPIVLTKKGLEELQIYSNQGLYGRAVAPMNTSISATKYLANKMTSRGVELVWFGNTALDLINEGGEMISDFANLFLYVAIVLAVFSVFMLYNYISQSIISKKQSIGVLRALGSGGKDIFLMFITESLIIALINGILASIVAGIGCIFVNMYIKNVMNLAISFAIYGSRQVIIIMVASIITAIASSLFPIIKIAKEKPVKLIREP